MKVLLTNTGPWGTGSGTVADGLMHTLLSMGHEVRAIFPDSGLPGDLVQKYYGSPDLYHIIPFPATFNGLELYTFPLIIPDPNPRNFKHAWTCKCMSNPEFKAYLDYIGSELKKLLLEFQPDVIECQHIWSFDNQLHQFGYFYACVAHHSDQLGFVYDSRMRPLARKSAEKATYIFAISDYVREEVIRLYEVDPAKVITIVNGFDGETFKPKTVEKKQLLAKLGLQLKADLPIVTFCGKISRTKGVDVLLRANRLIQQEKKTAILLLGSGSLDEFSAEERREFCLENIYLLGHRSPQDLAGLHNIARLSVLPSRSEGFGIAALEAMGTAIPVVASRTGGLPDFVVGQLVEPEDVTGLAAAILSLLCMEEEQYNEICRKARMTAVDYSWQSCTEKRMRYYEEIEFLNRCRSGNSSR